MPVYTRSPAVLAMMASTWSRLGGGRRMHLGIGAGGQGIIERWHGIDYDRPLATTRDTLAVLRQALAGERTDHQGPARHSTGLRLALGASDVQLHVGGLGPKMVELAAREADGLIVTWLSPRMVTDFRRGFEEQIEAAGRSADAVGLIVRVYVGVGDDVDLIRESVRKELVEYVVSPGYARFFISAGLGDVVANVTERFNARDRDGAVAAITDELLDAMLVAGQNADDIRDGLAAYLTAGADEIMVQAVPAARGADPKRTVAAVAEAVRAG